MQAGNYIGNIQKVAFSEASTGTPQFVCKFNVHTYAEAGQWVTIEPATRTVFLSVTDKTAANVKYKLSQIGVEGEPKFETDPSTGEDLLVLPSGASEHQVELTCRQEGDKERWDFTKYSAGGAAAKPASQNAKMVLKALWGKG